jgi:hypothetical protein
MINLITLTVPKDDLAAPMLKALHSPEWTAQDLEEVMFSCKL